MKKLKFLLVLTAVLFVNAISFAQVEDAAVTTEVQERVEVKVSDLPEAVTKALADQFAGYEVTQAFQTVQDGAEAFSVSLAKDEKSTVVVVDSQGNVLNNGTPEAPEEKE